MALKLRSEAEERFTWDFSDIYADDAAWEAAYNEIDAVIPEIAAIQGTLSESADSMKAGLDKMNAVSEKAERVYIYSMLRLNADNGDAKYQAMNGKARMLLVKLASVCAFVDPEILSMDEEKLAEIMKDPKVATYRHMLEDTNRNRPYIKSAKIEQMERELTLLGYRDVLEKMERKEDSDD